MKKLFALVVAAFAALLIVSCGSTQAAEPTQASKAGYPDWVYMSRSDATGIYAVGSGKMANPVTSRKMAMSQGRTELANILKTTVQAVTQTYINDAGSDKEREALTGFQESALQKTDAILQGSQQVDYFAAEDGTIYVLMYLPYDSAVKALNEEAAKAKATTFQQNSTAAFTNEKMEEAYEKYFSKSE